VESGSWDVGPKVLGSGSVLEVKCTRLFFNMEKTIKGKKYENSG